MNDRPPRDKNPSEPGKTSPGSLLDDFMKGEAMILLSRNTTSEDVDEKFAGARPRFAKNGLLTIGATTVELLTDETRERLKAGFTEFRLAGGTLIVVITTNQVVASLFRSIAIHCHIAIKIASGMKDSKEFSEAHRAKYHPKP